MALKLVLNPTTGMLDLVQNLTGYIKGTDVPTYETDPLSVHLDQTAPQTMVGTFKFPAVNVNKQGLGSEVPFKITGQGNYSGSPIDNDNGVGIAMVYNAPYNRQFWIGDSAEGSGIRINGTNIAGWNYLTKGDSEMLIGATGTYNSIMADTRFLADNRSLLFGAGMDAEMYYDGTNFILNPKRVGTGILDVMGGIDADYYTAITAQPDGINILQESTSTTDVKRAGVFICNYKGGASTVSINGINAQANTDAACTGNLTGTTAGGSLRNRYLVTHSGSGTVTKASVITTRTIVNNGVITTAANYLSETPSVASGKTITNFAHFNAEGAAITGAVTNLYGLLINDITEGATLNYAIKTGAGQVLFGDKVVFTQTDGNEYIDSLADGFMDYGATTAHRFLANLKLTADSRSIIFGAGDDMSVYYDGTGGYIKTSLVAASDLHLITGTGKTLVLDNSVWCDIDFPILIRTTGAGIPTLAAFNGNLTMPQWAVNDYNQCESQELIHEWKEGSLCQWHIHLTTNGLDATNRYVKFELEYAFCISGVWSFPAVVTTADILIPANTADKTQMIMQLATFTPSTSKIGDHVIARLKRVASTGTAPTNNPWIPMLQMHVEKDTIGSRTISAK